MIHSAIKHLKEAYTLCYGKDISLVTNYVTVQFLCIQFRIKIVVPLAIKIEMKN
jgi:hypothetical protein